MGRKPFIKLAKLKNIKCGTQSPFLTVIDAMCEALALLST